MNPNRELTQLVKLPSARRRNRWYGEGISQCLAGHETVSALRKQTVNWDKVLGLATVLVVVALGWTAVGIAVFRFLR